MEVNWQEVPLAGARRFTFPDAHLRTSWRVDRPFGTMTYTGRMVDQYDDDLGTCVTIAIYRTSVSIPLPPLDMLLGDGASSSLGPRFVRTRVVPRGRRRIMTSAPPQRPREGRRFAVRLTERTITETMTRQELDFTTPTICLDETETDTCTPATEEDPSEVQGQSSEAMDSV